MSCCKSCEGNSNVLQEVSQHIENQRQMLAALRKGLTYQPFDLIVQSGQEGGTSGQAPLMHRQCWLDGIHFPDPNPGGTSPPAISVVITEGGITKFSRQVTPGEVVQLYGIPCHGSSLRITASAPVLVWGRIRE